MNRICILFITVFMINTVYSESSFNPKGQFEIGGDINYSIYRMNHGHPTSYLYFQPIVQYYWNNWLYAGPSIFFHRISYHNYYGYDRWVEYYEKIGLKIGIMGNLGSFIYPCLEVSTTFNFEQYKYWETTSFGDYPPIKIGYFRGIVFPVSVVGKIPLTSSLILNLNSTLFWGFTTEDNVDFVFSIGLSGLLKNDIFSIKN